MAPDCLSHSANVFIKQNCWIGYDFGHTVRPNMCSLQTMGAGIAQSLQWLGYRLNNPGLDSQQGPEILSHSQCPVLMSEDVIPLHPYNLMVCSNKFPFTFTFLLTESCTFKNPQTANVLIHCILIHSVFSVKFKILDQWLTSYDEIHNTHQP